MHSLARACWFSARLILLLAFCSIGMCNDPPPPSADHTSNDETPYGWIDEWLCEYVDGTMDPAQEAVFTSYVEANPDLKAHIEELKRTRALLGQCGMPDPPPTKEAQNRVCDHVESDLLRSRLSLTEALSTRPRFTAGLFVSVLAALMIGVVVGSATVAPSPSSPASTFSDRAMPNQGMNDRAALPAMALPSMENAPQSATAIPTSPLPRPASLDAWTVPVDAVDSLRDEPTLGVVRTQR